MYATAHHTALLLLFMVTLFSCYNGELILYVHADHSQDLCPPNVSSTHCRLLSEYAASSYNLTLHPNTTFAFLPGRHVLDLNFSVDSDLGVEHLSLRPIEPGVDDFTSISICRSGRFYFTNLTSVSVNFLKMVSCTFSFEAISLTYIDIASIQNCSFINGAVAALQVYNVSIENCVFTNGTVVALELLSASFQRCFFTNCTVIAEDVYNASIHNCSFSNSTNTAVLLYNSSLLFSGNQVSQNMGTWMTLIDCRATLKDSSFFHFPLNFEDFYYAGLYILNSSVIISGRTLFQESQFFAAVVSGSSSILFLMGMVRFERNRRAVILVESAVTIQNGSDLRFQDNYDVYGGAIFAILSTIHVTLDSNVTFINNSAFADGGALYLIESTVFLNADGSGSVLFRNNHAGARGGAVFVQDTIPTTYCSDTDLGKQACSFQVENYNDRDVIQTKIRFLNNSAGVAGSAIYGGALDSCVLDSDSNRDSVNAGDDAGSLFDQLVNITTYSADSSPISSEPYTVCSCDGSIPNCINNSVTYKAYPGAELEVSLVAYGQRRGSIPATIIVLEGDVPGLTLTIPGECSNLTILIQPPSDYTDTYNRSFEFQLFASGPCHTSRNGLDVEVEVLRCPPGFTEDTLDDNTITCNCDPRLEKYLKEKECDIQTRTVLHDDNFWVGYNDDDGLILHSPCPFDYCLPGTFRLRVEDSDAQCNHDRSGLLCGECSEGLSLLLGSSSCEKCSDSYLALLLFFAVAGVILVAVLLLLNLTVAVGTINGLIFYVNIVAANEALVFPSKSNGYLDFLKVFIAWINLDFGIKSCFYDGMDQYTKTWLLYVFPVYIWVLIGLVFLVSRFSTIVAKSLGSNPVAVLASLFLLSYTNFISAIIEAFTWATLDYPGSDRVVWWYDGNVPFLDTSDSRHLVLFVASLLCLIVVSIPYTLLLLTSQWLQIKSHWKVLSWLNKPQLRSFLDAYHAPYKPRHRYWPGVLLLVRLVILLTSAFARSANRGLVFLVIEMLVLIVQMWNWTNGGVYKKRYLNVLEAFFFLNLGFLMCSNYYIESELSSDRTARSAATSTLLTTAFIAFFGIVIFHVYVKIDGTERIYNPLRNIIHRKATSQQPIELEDPAENKEGITTSYVSLREPLLDA